MRVCFLDPLENRVAELPEQFLGQHQVSLANGNAGDVPADTEAVITWGDSLDQPLIARLPNLRLVQRVGWYRTGGDLAAAEAAGAAVAVWPKGVSNRVAMHTLMFMLALGRQLLPSYRATIAGENEIGMEPTYMEQPAIAMNWPIIANVDTAANKTLGIIGFGEIGACFARMARPYDMDTLYYKRQRLSPAQEDYFGVRYAPLDDLLAQSDYVSTFVPYSKESERMLGAREFGLMKPSAYFINTGRGNTTDEAALMNVLREGRIRGAALDVFSFEPLPPDHPVLSLKNVVLTPHNAGGVGGWHDVFTRIVMNLDAVAAGRRPVTWGYPPR